MAPEEQYPRLASGFNMHTYHNTRVTYREMAKRLFLSETEGTKPTDAERRMGAARGGDGRGDGIC